MRITGACECGATSYEIADDSGIDVANCHCRACRRSSGGAYVTWATVPKNRFSWTGRRPGSRTSSAHGRRYFCLRCGAQLALYTAKSPDTIDVTVATMSHPERYPPDRDIWLSRKLPWIPRDRRLRGEERESFPAG